MDMGLTDTGLRDAGLADTGFRDAGLADTGLRDAGLADTGLRGVGFTKTCSGLSRISSTTSIWLGVSITSDRSLHSRYKNKQTNKHFT